jgi:hypothetical protein
MISGSIYVGVSKVGKCREDSYLGSGTALLCAIEKYGRENFTRTTLFECSTAEEAYLIEAAVVDEEWVKRDDTYNLKTGGMGGMGFTFTMPEAAKEKIRQYRLGRQHTAETREKISDSLKGRTLSEEQRQKISESVSRSNSRRTVSEETRKLLAQRQRESWARGRKSRRDGVIHNEVDRSVCEGSGVVDIQNPRRPDADERNP